jgi:glycosyltransferase involved in cell wall biosynthesis
MQILINAASAHMGGAVTYLQNVLRRLPEQAAVHRVIVYVPKATTEVLPNRPEVDVRPYPYSSTRGLSRLYFDQVRMPRIAAREKVDVLLSATGFGTVWSPAPQVLLVRNMKYFDPRFEEKYRALGRSFLKTRLRRWHSLLSIGAADAVLFPTQAMEETVGTYVALGGTPTRALHYGYDGSSFTATGEAGDAVPDALRPHAVGEGPLLLNVSTYAVHKNLEALIEALPHLLDHHPTLTLATTTSREQTSDIDEYDALKERAATLGVADAWVELGYVPHAELPPVYRAADAYVFPSFTESFGHSMVEALACGLPVVAADTAVNREVCAEAGVYFAPFDSTDCARAVRRVLDDDVRRAKQRRAAVRRAGHFSWKRYTEDLAEVFQQTAAGG